MPVAATGVLTKVTLGAGEERFFAAWHSRFSRAASSASGFVSLEIIPTSEGAAEWHLIQRFRSAELLELWRESSVRASLFAELTPHQAPGQTKPQDEATPDFHALSSVTEVVTTAVEAGKEAEFLDWSALIQAQQAIFSGYMGTLIQAPLSADLPLWVSLVRYATPGQLEAWLASPERNAILERADPSVSRWKTQRMASPFAGWFPSEPGAPSAAAWKQTSLVLLVLFPVVMLEIKFLSPFLKGQHVAVATFIGNAISVSLVSWPLMKIAIGFLGWWLQPDPAHRARTEIMGICTMLVLYAIEILTFMVLY